jgi:hypothetical protein
MLVDEVVGVGDFEFVAAGDEDYIGSPGALTIVATCDK